MWSGWGRCPTPVARPSSREYTLAKAAAAYDAVLSSLPIGGPRHDHRPGGIEHASRTLPRRTRRDRMTLPTFVGIGVARGGTTWLHTLLSGHPDVYMPDAPEGDPLLRPELRSRAWTGTRRSSVHQADAARLRCDRRDLTAVLLL